MPLPESIYPGPIKRLHHHSVMKPFFYIVGWSLIYNHGSVRMAGEMSLAITVMSGLRM